MSSKKGPCILENLVTLNNGFRPIHAIGVIIACGSWPHVCGSFGPGGFVWYMLGPSRRYYHVSGLHLWTIIPMGPSTYIVIPRPKSRDIGTTLRDRYICGYMDPLGMPLRSFHFLSRPQATLKGRPTPRA